MPLSWHNASLYGSPPSQKQDVFSLLQLWLPILTVALFCRISVASSASVAMVSLWRLSMVFWYERIEKKLSNASL